MRRLLGLWVALVCLLPVGAASAQTGWLADRSRSEGPGFRVGDFELHPGLGVEVGWDSNLYFTEDNPDPAMRTDRGRVDTGILRVTPHFLFSTIGQQRREQGEARDDAESSPPTVAFRGGVSAAYYEFFADPNRRNVEINGSMRLQVLPQRPFSFTIYDEFQRSVRPFTENFNPAAAQARIGNQAGLDLAFQTEGGIVQVRAGYIFGLDFFEDNRFQYASSFSHTISLQESFRFLPQTAFIHDTTFIIQDYFGNITASPVLLSDNFRLRTRVGLNGAITPEVSLQGMVGYTAGFYPNTVIAGTPYDQDYDSIVAQVELRWQIMQGMRLSLGYDRDFFSSFVGNYYSRDRGYLNFQMLIAGAFLLGADFEVGYVDFGLIRGGPTGIIDTTGGVRQDIRIGGGLFAEYRFTDWLGINATFRYQGQLTNYQYTNVAFVDPAQFNKFEVFGGVRVFY
jgi:hypothetical protein